MQARHRQERGAALLLAMITVALVATIAATALWQQWRGVEVESAERNRVQAAWILTGALDWGRLLLEGDLSEDRRKPTLVDHLGEPWAVPLAEARLSTFLAAGEMPAGVDGDAFLAGQIMDLQARLNVMNLVSEDAEGALLRFQRLFDLLQLPPSELRRLQQGLMRAQEALQEPATGADAPLMPQQPRQLHWLGLAPASVQALLPHVAVLPLQSRQPTLVNLNTASAEVLHAAVPGLDMAAAQRLLAARQHQYFSSTRQAMEAAGPADADPAWAAVASRFFEIRGRLRLRDSVVEEIATVQRSSSVRGRGIQVQTLWRERRTQVLSGPAFQH